MNNLTKMLCVVLLSGFVGNLNSANIPRAGAGGDAGAGALPVYINAEDRNGETALFKACALGDLERVRELVRAGADQTLTDLDLRTPFYIACANGHIDVVRYLAGPRGRVDINERNLDGYTPFYAACANGHIDIVQYLAGLGNRVNIMQVDHNRWTPFHAACAKGHIDVVEYLAGLVDLVNIMITNGCSWTPLTSACFDGHFDVVKYLVGLEGVDIMQALDNGSTPLMMACVNGNLDVVRFLVSSNDTMDINKSNNNGWTALTQACFNRNLDVVKFLLSTPGIKVTDLDRKMAVEPAIKRLISQAFDAASLWEKRKHLLYLRSLLNARRAKSNVPHSKGGKFNSDGAGVAGTGAGAGAGDGDNRKNKKQRGQ